VDLRVHIQITRRNVKKKIKMAFPLKHLIKPIAIEGEFGQNPLKQLKRHLHLEVVMEALGQERGGSRRHSAKCEDRPCCVN
jgi:hypothetical protein